ncbi:MAG: pseudouridine synthase, partial [Bacillota bacterium]|nr:pseudouridine synthase [Bacillota bacterium]
NGGFNILHVGHIRSLIDDIGAKLGCGATLTTLRRTQACGFRIEQSVSLEQAKRLSEDGILENEIKTVESLFMQYNEVVVSSAQSMRFQNGGALALERTSIKKADDGEIFRVKSSENEFIGLGIADGNENVLKILKLFSQ